MPSVKAGARAPVSASSPVQPQLQPQATEPALTAGLGHSWSRISVSSPAASGEKGIGLPAPLQQGIEQLSGVAMDGVEVHRSSPRPAEIKALAFAQGNQIHLGPGQEKHLPHEAWHVAQQRQGRVGPTLQARGLSFNISPGLEAEAETMGARAEQLSRGPMSQTRSLSQNAQSNSTIQPKLSTDVLLPWIKHLREDQALQKQEIKIHEMRLFHWNNLDKFDSIFKTGTPDQIKAELIKWNDISENAAGPSEPQLQDGQLHKNEKLPGFLDYFARFCYPLPGNLGVLWFEKRFDRMTEHGWISTNCALPARSLNSGKQLAVHMIIAVQDPILDGNVVCNPHVTIRLQEEQDQLTMISMMTDRTEKTAEMKKLGKGAANASVSIGLNSVRKIDDPTIMQALGLDPGELKLFSQNWIAGVIQAAAAAAAQSAPAKAKKFTLK